MHYKVYIPFKTYKYDCNSKNGLSKRVDISFKSLLKKTGLDKDKLVEQIKNDAYELLNNNKLFNAKVLTSEKKIEFSYISDRTNDPLQKISSEIYEKSGEYFGEHTFWGELDIIFDLGYITEVKEADNYVQSASEGSSFMYETQLDKDLINSGKSLKYKLKLISSYNNVDELIDGYLDTKGLYREEIEREEMYLGVFKLNGVFYMYLVDYAKGVINV